MSGLKHLFTDLREINYGFVSFGDASKVEVKGKGEISFSKIEGRQRKIEDIYFVRDLKNNILSRGQLFEKGYSIFMENKVMFLKDENGGTIYCSNRNVPKLEFQTKLEEHAGDMYASEDTGQSNLVAQETWTPTLRWSKRDVKQRDSSWNSLDF